MFEELIKQKAKEIEEEIISIRRDIHKHPEEGLKEFRTSKLVFDKLAEYNINSNICSCGTGVIGNIKGKEDGKTVMLRADMDCLKLTENTGLTFSSEVTGLMHACGHDVHTAALLGAAKILSSIREKINGNIKFVFQPAEEFSGGALLMIKAGVLENPSVDAVFGAHIWPYINTGTVAIKSGSMMAASDNFKLTIFGRGGHGGHPHKCNDPIASACEIYMAFQTIISRSMDPLEPAVITVGKFDAGTAHNVIPDKVSMVGTIRTLTKESRLKVKELMEKIINGITAANGAKYEFLYEPYHPPVINDEKLSRVVEKTAVKLFGADNFQRLERPTMAGEDFSFYEEKVPGAFFYVGTLKEDIGATKPLHSSEFIVDEENIIKMSTMLAQCTVDFLLE